MVRSAFAVALLAMFIASLGLVAQDKPKFTIKEVMKEAHKDGLLKKASGKDGTKADREKLLELYKALAANKCPKGDGADWKKRTEEIVKAAEDAVKDEKAAGALGKAVNCKGCHDGHK